MPAVCALASTLALPSSARANAPAPFVREPNRFDGAFVVKPTSLIVEHEELTFRCSEPKPTCAFEAVYHVRNGGDATEEILGAFYGIASHAITIRARGADARHDLTAEQLAVTDAAVLALDPTIGGGHPETLGRTGFSLAVEAHARVDLVFTGTMDSIFDTDWTSREMALEPLEARHPWLSTRERDETRDDFAYALSPIRSWAGAPAIDVTVRFPRSLTWRQVDRIGWKLRTEGDERVARATIPAASASTLRFRFVHPGTTVLSGGPLLGIGGRIDARELRVRAGYELATPDWVVYSAAVETSFHGRTTLVPLVEVASPDIAIVIPSLGLGAGVPVQLRSNESTLVGVRAQFTMSFPVLSLVVPFDWFPGASGGDVTQISMMGQASF